MNKGKVTITVEWPSTSVGNVYGFLPSKNRFKRLFGLKDKVSLAITNITIYGNDPRPN